MPSDFASVLVRFVHGLGHASLMPSDMGRRGLDLGSSYAFFSVVVQTDLKLLLFLGHWPGMPGGVC